MSALLEAAKRGPLSPAQQQQLRAQYEAAARARGEVPATSLAPGRSTRRQLARRFVRRHYLAGVLVLAKMIRDGHATTYAVAHLAAANFPTLWLGALFAWLATVPGRRGEDSDRRRDRIRRLARRRAPALVELLAMVIGVPESILGVTRLRADIAMTRRRRAGSRIDLPVIEATQTAHQPTRVRPIEGARRVTGTMGPLAAKVR
jgi:hypothetical protein